MCGIFAVFNIKGTYEKVRAKVYKLSKRQRHRGPDKSGLVIIEVGPNLYNAFAHERLNIVDLSQNGKQPFVMDDESVIWLHNGELYNYIQHRPQLEGKYKFKGHSDSEIVGPLYKELGAEQLWGNLDGMWGIVLYDNKLKRFWIGRDHVGIIPLYWGTGKEGELYVSSEFKCIEDQVNEIQHVLPGHYISNEHKQIQWYKPQWHNIDHIPNRPVDYEELRNLMTNVVKRELMGDAPFGLFISGGVDSSVIAGIVMKLVKSGEIDIKARGMTKVHSFCVGLEGSPDLYFAQQVAEFLGTEHHSFTYTVSEGLDMIPEVIYHTETFNNTTIRASTPMYFMSRCIKALGIKMCLTGEGADELFGGYLYFHKAPNGKEFHQECVRKVQDLYKYDLLRANKSTAAWGLEVRPPFMNKQVIEYVMSIDPNAKMISSHQPSIEKYILRKAFDDEINPYVPKSILWRQKEQFSDGVGYSWRDGIREQSDKLVSNLEFENRFIKYPISTPMDKEQYWYRMIFEEHFSNQLTVKTVPYAKSIACSTEKALEWDESFRKNADESGRAVLSVHQPLKYEIKQTSQQLSTHYTL